MYNKGAVHRSKQEFIKSKDEVRKSDDEVEEDTNTKFTFEINGERYYVDKSVKNDPIIISLLYDGSKSFKVWCKNHTHQKAEVVVEAFKKFKCFEAISEDNAGLQVSFKTARSAVDCYKAMMNDETFPCYNINAKLSETEKKIFFSQLRRQNRLLEPQKSTYVREQHNLEKVLKLESQVNFTPKEKTTNVKNSLRLPFLKKGFVFIRYVKPDRPWQNQDVMNRIVKAIIFDNTSLDSILLSISMDKEQKPLEIPCLQHLRDLYIDSLTEKFTLYDVLVCGLPNHYSQKELHSLIKNYVHDELESIECYNIADEGLNLQYCIVYVHSLNAAKYLIKSLNNRVLFEKTLTAILLSLCHQRYSLLKKSVC